MQQHPFQHDAVGHDDGPRPDTPLLSFWRKAVTFAVAIPLTVLKNGLRIFVLGVLTTKVDPSFFTGRLHRQGGIVYFLIALSCIFLLLWFLRRGENQQAKHPRDLLLK